MKSEIVRYSLISKVLITFPHKFAMHEVVSHPPLRVVASCRFYVFMKSKPVGFHVKVLLV